ncbi:uncharacterized protein LOC122712547 [Apis laboriosa]|uniref:uncharacterized protein LOC122712547 n=1 Tax=Apis laboriosa TaxID=183418 RepID=UPI001CC37D88|nr:uncharacterized protein LOC122712547 [Apis laboriosa]
MNVFDSQYRTYRIILKIIGLWPYDNSIYVWIQRLSLLMYFLMGIIFQIILLIKSEITLQNCVITLSEIFPVLLFFLRYLHCITLFSYAEILFDNISAEEHLLQDSTEIQIQMKYLDISNHIIHIFCWMSFTGITAFMIFLLIPITLDIIMPLNESRAHFNVLFLFGDQSAFIKIFFILNFMLILSFGLLCIMGTEFSLNIFCYYISRQFHIVSYRIRRIVENLSMPILSKQIDLKFTEIHRIVDIYNHAIEHINFATNNGATQYLIAIIVCILSFSVNLYRLYNAIITMDNRIEISGSALVVIYHLMIAFYNNHYGQLIIDSNLGIFNELYSSTWYRIPLKAQKLLLLMILRTSMGCELRLSGLFTPSYVGFTSMMSSSFSYCAVIYSIQ